MFAMYMCGLVLRQLAVPQGTDVYRFLGFYLRNPFASTVTPYIYKHWEVWLKNLVPSLIYKEAFTSSLSFRNTNELVEIGELVQEKNYAVS